MHRTVAHPLQPLAAAMSPLRTAAHAAPRV